MEKLTREERREAVEALRRWFREDRGEDAGELAAGLLLDRIEDEVAHLFYNRGVRDATTRMLAWIGSLEEDLASLEARPKRP